MLPDRSKTKYPRILIIGETFHQNSGGGITLTNLFKDWPKDRLANAVDFRNSNMNFSFTGIKIYELYKCKMIFNLFSHKFLHKFRSSSNSNINIDKTNFKTLVKLFLKKIAYKVLEYSGCEPVIFKYRIDISFIRWIEEFNPDFIYSQLSSRESIRLISNLKDITNKSIAIHIMDDWPSTICSRGLFKSYWSSKINKEFSNLLQKSSVLLSISEYMSEEYLKRYQKRFIPFHNPVDLSMWENSINKSPKSNESIIFLHAGRIGKGISNSLLEIARTLQEINDQYYKVVLQIQSSFIDPQFRKKISMFSCVRINPPIEYLKIPEVIKNADILVLCNDFDERGKNFLRYSMPTKASEYMISKVPILLYSDQTSAVFKHAKKNNWAYLIGENNPLILKNSILDFIKNTELQKEIAERAYQFAKLNYNSEIIRERFRKTFIEVIDYSGKRLFKSSTFN